MVVASQADRRFPRERQFVRHMEQGGFPLAVPEWHAPGLTRGRAAGCLYESRDPGLVRTPCAMFGVAFGTGQSESRTGTSTGARSLRWCWRLPLGDLHLLCASSTRPQGA